MTLKELWVKVMGRPIKRQPATESELEKRFVLAELEDARRRLRNLRLQAEVKNAGEADARRNH